MALFELFTDYTLRTVALGSGILGVTSGVLGSFAVLRKQSLLGDAISHAALPGIVLAFIVTGSKASVVLVLGAGIAGWIATLLVGQIVRSTRVKYDSALGIALSSFFAFGLMLLTFVQKRPEASQAGLDKFLFGQAAALLQADVVTMAGLSVVALAGVAAFWKELKLLSFDPGFGASLGFPMRAVDLLLTSLLVLAIVIGLQTVGVVLMSAMVVGPGAAARQWTDRLGAMVFLSALFGVLAGVGGAVISSSSENLPTGPVIVLTLSALVLLSLSLGRKRGLVWEWARARRSRHRLRVDGVLDDLYLLESQHTDVVHGHSSAVLETMTSDPGSVHASLEALQGRGFVTRERDGWALTPAGRSRAEGKTAQDPPHGTDGT